MMKDFNNSERFIVSEDIAGIIDPMSFSLDKRVSVSEYFCHLLEDSKKEHVSRITKIEKNPDNSIIVVLNSSDELISSLLSNSRFSELNIRFGENKIFSRKGVEIISSFVVKFSSGDFHTVALTIS